MHLSIYLSIDAHLSMYMVQLIWI
uniref:Uncharacterized protein n=1 Tax=Anguilla anguilla TaxID=7936 RepID=A0A0E9T3M3_ANGAN